MARGAYAILWHYRVKAEHCADFVRVYGPEGEWAALFAKADGYIRTELLMGEETGVYATIDYWRAREDFDAFQEHRGAEYRKLDMRCDAWTLSEELMGRFMIAAP